MLLADTAEDDDEIDRDDNNDVANDDAYESEKNISSKNPSRLGMMPIGPTA